jgi:hypothetical protein
MQQKPEGLLHAGLVHDDLKNMCHTDNAIVSTHISCFIPIVSRCIASVTHVFSLWAVPIAVLVSTLLFHHQTIHAMIRSGYLCNLQL